jgi:hypothetical protein
MPHIALSLASMHHINAYVILTIEKANISKRLLLTSLNMQSIIKLKSHYSDRNLKLNALIRKSKL